MDSLEFDKFSAKSTKEVFDLKTIEACSAVLVMNKRTFSLIFVRSDMRKQFLAILVRHRRNLCISLQKPPIGGMGQTRTSKSAAGRDDDGNRFVSEGSGGGESDASYGG